LVDDGCGFVGVGVTGGVGVCDATGATPPVLVSAIVNADVLTISLL
jgi:hypothetical protein